MRCSAKGFLCAFQQVFAVLVGARQVKDSKTVRCQDLEEAGCPPNPKELDRTGAGFALAVQHSLCRTIDIQAQRSDHLHCSRDKVPRRGETL